MSTKLTEPVDGMPATKRGRATREALLDAADHLLERDGLDAVTLRAVGALADVSRQAPYRHFTDKGALLTALATRYYDEVSALMDARSATSDDVLADIAVVFVEWAIRHPRRYKLMVSEDVLGHASGGPLLAAESAFDRIESAMPTSADHDPSEPHVDAMLLFSGLHGILDLTISGILGPDKGVDPATLARVLVSHFRPGTETLRHPE